MQLFVTTKCWFWKTSFLSLDLCKWDWFENCHASKIILFLQCSFQFSKKHAIWWKWLSQCYFCPGDQNMLQVKTNKKKRCRAGTYTFLVGKNLSLFRTLTEVMIVISMRQKKKKKNWLKSEKLHMVLWTFDQCSFALSGWCKNQLKKPNRIYKICILQLIVDLKSLSGVASKEPI